MHLHLLAPQGEGQDPPKRRRGIPSSALSLTATEVRHLRAAVRGLVKTRYGTLVALARALNVIPSILTRKKRPSPGLAVALWRLTGIPLDKLLGGGLAAAPPPPEAPAEGSAS